MRNVMGKRIIIGVGYADRFNRLMMLGDTCVRLREMPQGDGITQKVLPGLGLVTGPALEDDRFRLFPKECASRPAQ